MDYTDFESVLPESVRDRFAEARKRAKVRNAGRDPMELRAEREQRAQENMMQSLRESCVRGTKDMLGERFAEKTFENFEKNAKNKEALMEAKTLAEKFKPGHRGLLLIGPNGIGKNHLAAAVANEIAKGIRYTYFGSIVSIKNRIMDAFGYSVEGAIDKILSYDLICINDLGAEKDSEWTQEIVFGLIDGAYEDKKTIIITTNLKDVELFKRYGKRIISRLMEMCNVVEYEDRDHRI